ncbi:MAG: response regulator receiver protein [Magnetococcales bacterium]|nr:response regulator receiver protein [Magnetococcales bacterium]HIJ82796.1 SpoIIE family protein phosphatase [Magnetococcales bacterium]
MSNSKTRKPIILVVDDTAENIDVLNDALISDYTVRSATSGQIALKAANVKPHPDLILLDIMMLDMDGYEVCRRLKADSATREIPIIFVTTKSEMADELEGLKLGAVDYITKPFSIPIVLARVKTQLALSAAHRKLDDQNQILLEERELIENIILKMRQADRLDTRHLRYLIAPVEVTAGDMLLSSFTPDGRQLVLLGDFTGHGLPAAIGGPMVTDIFYNLTKSGVFGAQILDEINSQLCIRMPVNIFLAASLVEISPGREHATLWNAGLPHALLVRRGSIQRYFPSTIMFLGVSVALNIPEAAMSLSLEPGDLLYSFSDGIIEAKDTRGNMFGMRRLEDFLTPAIVKDLVLEDLIVLLNEHVGSSVHNDDITLVEIHI